MFVGFVTNIRYGSNLPHVGPQAFLGPDLFREDVREGGLKDQKVIVI